MKTGVCGFGGNIAGVCATKEAGELGGMQILSCLVVSCTKYDDSAINSRIDHLQLAVDGSGKSHFDTWAYRAMEAIFSEEPYRMSRMIRRKCAGPIS